MPKCRNCEKGGWFTNVDSNGLCGNCAPLVVPLIMQHARVVLESAKIIQASQSASTKLSRINVAIAHCRNLEPFERKGIPTLSEPLRDVIDTFSRMRASVLADSVREHVFLARQKAMDAATDSGKLGGYARAIEHLSKLMDDVEDIVPLEEAVLALRTERDALRFDLLERKAETALAKGKPKQAIDIYVEAIMALRHDNTPDNWQLDRLQRAEARLADLRS